MKRILRVPVVRETHDRLAGGRHVEYGELDGLLDLLLLLRQLLVCLRLRLRDFARHLRRIEIRRRRSEHLPIDDRLITLVRLTLGEGREYENHAK